MKIMTQGVEAVFDTRKEIDSSLYDLVNILSN